MTTEKDPKILAGNIVVPVMEVETVPGAKSYLPSMLTVNRGKEWFSKQREQLKPWGSFVNSGKFQPPKSVTSATSRVMRNVEYFQANYLFVFVGLAAFCLLTSPMLLIVLAAFLGACYIISLKNQGSQITVMGMNVPLMQQYAGAAVLSLPFFWIAGAGGAVFWLLGASLFVIMLHAAMYNSDEMAAATPFETV